MSRQDWNQSQYYQEDFLASHSVQPGSEEARKMTVTSGLRCLELYRRSDPVGSFVRMLLESSAWRSTRCFLTWKESATPAKRLLFRLVPSMPRTGGTDARLLPTPRKTMATMGVHTKEEYVLKKRPWNIEDELCGTPNPEYAEWLGVPSKLDIGRNECLGNAVVPQQFYPIFRGIADLEE